MTHISDELNAKDNFIIIARITISIYYRLSINNYVQSFTIVHLSEKNLEHLKFNC